MNPQATLNIVGSGLVPMEVNSLAHGQIAAHLNIPKVYYDRMLFEQPQLLADNVNTWLERNAARHQVEKNTPEKRMVKVLDGRVRAFLSNSYRTLTNFDLAHAVLPVLGELGVQVMSSEITERRFYLKVVDNKISKSIPNGKQMGDGSHEIFDTLTAAMVISNSEVGFGALSVETAIWTKACTNLSIFAQQSVRKYHIGARAELGEEMFKLLSEDTRKKTDVALWAQTKDVVKSAFDKAQFESNVRQISELVDQPIQGDPVKVVEVTAKRFGMNDQERTGVLRHLIKGGDLSRYGLLNAVTRTAEDVPDYDRATEFERFGGQIIGLDKKDWGVLANAA